MSSKVERIILDKLYCSWNKDERWFGYKKYEMERLARQLAPRFTEAEAKNNYDWFQICERWKLI